MRKCPLAILLLATVSATTSSAKVDYVSQIQPIFDAKCGKCHSPTRTVDGRRYKPKAGVVLTSPEGIAEAMVIDWGRPTHSLLVERISHDAGHEDVMPPAKANNPVTKAELDLIKTWITETGGAGAAPVADAKGGHKKISFSQVESILSSKCYKCHNSKEKPKGGLILDTIGGIRTSGSVDPGKPGSSELLIRMELPPSDDDVMPPKKEGMTVSQAEIATVRDWILGGAPFGDVGGAPLKAKVMTADQVLSAGVKLPNASAVAALSAQGASITPISAESPMVAVEFISGAARANDDFVKELFLIAPNISELDLSRTSITDASLEYIGNFARLTKLVLANTKVTDAGIEKLAGLKKLDYINLYATGVTDSAVPSLMKIRTLRSIYLSKTKVTAEGESALKKSFPSAKIVRDIQANTDRFDVE